MQGAIGIGFMQTLSYALSLPLRCLGIGLSIPVVIAGKGYDLLFKKSPPEPHTILVVGGSSGIGKEVALQYAKPGNHISIVARNKERLEAVGKMAREKGATVTIASIDAVDASKMREFIQKQDDSRPIDLVVAAAGFITPPNAASYSLPDLIDCIYKGNMDTCRNSVLPLVDRMRQRRRGQICIISSIAGLGMKNVNPIYTSTKMATYAFGESLRMILEPFGVFVNIVCPGPTKTAIFDTTGTYSAGLLSAEWVAQRIVAGLRRDETVIECDIKVNLLTGFLVRDIPKLARDYLYRAFYPIARRRGLFVVEYPSLFKKWRVCWLTCVWEEGGERIGQEDEDGDKDDDGKYSARAPMSRNEGEEEEELLV